MGYAEVVLSDFGPLDLEHFMAQLLETLAYSYSIIGFYVSKAPRCKQ